MRFRRVGLRRSLCSRLLGSFGVGRSFHEGGALHVMLMSLHGCADSEQRRRDKQQPGQDGPEATVVRWHHRLLEWESATQQRMPLSISLTRTFTGRMAKRHLGQQYGSGTG